VAAAVQQQTKKNKEIYQVKKKKKIYHNGMENGVFSLAALEHNDVIPSSTGRQVKSRDTDSTANKKKINKRSKSKERRKK
jgi:hypothetical protein